MFMSALPACVYSVCRGHKRASDPLELELQTVVRLHVGARNQTYEFPERAVSTPSL